MKVCRQGAPAIVQFLGGRYFQLQLSSGWLQEQGRSST